MAPASATARVRFAPVEGAAQIFTEHFCVYLCKLHDDFTPRARQDYNDLPPDVIANRAKLREAMSRHGFDPLPTEWWHFDFRGWKRFELMDIPLQNLATMETEPTR